eukprot:SM000005S17174  [mRNA]  locus=s5:560784:563546:- [translate_table: standard]
MRTSLLPLAEQEMLCYCTPCCKTGGGGYAVNLAGDYGTLKLDGEEHVGRYNAIIHRPGQDKPEPSTAYRAFCKLCGSALFLYDPTWPELVHPFATAIDSELPQAPERTHLMLGSKASWVQPAIGSKDKQFDEYPEESIAQWHQRAGMEVPL